MLLISCESRSGGTGRGAHPASNLDRADGDAEWPGRHSVQTFVQPADEWDQSRPPNPPRDGHRSAKMQQFKPGGFEHPRDVRHPLDSSIRLATPERIQVPDEDTTARPQQLSDLLDSLVERPQVHECGHREEAVIRTHVLIRNGERQEVRDLPTYRQRAADYLFMETLTSPGQRDRILAQIERRHARAGLRDDHGLIAKPASKIEDPLAVVGAAFEEPERHGQIPMQHMVAIRASTRVDVLAVVPPLVRDEREILGRIHRRRDLVFGGSIDAVDERDAGPGLHSPPGRRLFSSGTWPPSMARAVRGLNPCASSRKDRSGFTRARNQESSWTQAPPSSAAPSPRLIERLRKSKLSSSASTLGDRATRASRRLHEAAIGRMTTASW